MRRHILIEILTDAGISGIGDTWTNFPEWAVDERKITLTNIKPLLIGKDPLKTNDIWRTIEKNVLYSSAGLQYGAKGPLYQAISGIDIALWDIMGKAYNVPVYRLLNGEVHDQIKAYASGIDGNNYKQFVPKALKQGIDFFKVKIGFGEQTDNATMKAVRELIGNRGLFADANQKWINSKEAIKQINKLHEFSIDFIEEPTIADSIENYRYIKEHINIPIAAGENRYSREAFVPYLEDNLIDIIQPDVTKCGGITETWAISEMTRLNNTKLALHMFSTAIGLAASLQIMFASKQAYIMEYDIAGNEMISELASQTFFRLKDGYFEIDKNMPGIGVELSKDFLDKYVVR